MSVISVNLASIHDNLNSSKTNKTLARCISKLFGVFKYHTLWAAWLFFPHTKVTLLYQFDFLIFSVIGNSSVRKRETPRTLISFDQKMKARYIKNQIYMRLPNNGLHSENTLRKCYLHMIKPIGVVAA